MNSRFLAIGLSAVLVTGAIATASVLGRTDSRTDPAPPPVAAPPTQATASPVGRPVDPAFWPRIGFGEASSEVEFYADVPSMTRAATVVVDAEIVASAPTRVVGADPAVDDEGVRFTGHELRVHEVLAGELWTADDTGGHTVIETMGGPVEVSPGRSTRGIYFLVHKLDRLVPGAPLPERDSALEGEEKYYRFISSQGLLVGGPHGEPLFPLSADDQTNAEIRASVGGKSFRQVADGIA